MRYVIIGGSIAGISAAKAIRTKDSHAAVTVISGEPFGQYYRPLIPMLISGRKNESDILYPEDPLHAEGINRVVGSAIRVDTNTREVLLASGDRISYDRLLIATGGVALKPRIPGLDSTKAAFPLRNVIHAQKLRQHAASAASAVVIGGGLVGIKAALALREAGRPEGKAPMDVAVVEMLPEILNGRLDHDGAAAIRAAVEERGVDIHRNEQVKRLLSGSNGRSKVRLGSGGTVDADLIVVAAGVRPNIAFLRGSGIKTRRGVLVDETLLTNIPDVYAAGDVAEGVELLSGKRAVSGLWTNAQEMGRLAGLNMAGGNATYPGFLAVMNASEIAGIPFVSAGTIDTAGRGFDVAIGRENGKYWKLVKKGDFLVGVVLVGDISRAGLYVNLIKNRIPLKRDHDKVMRRMASYAQLQA
ncbi:MAG: FAD-dependent oxidoreductase [Nitrospiraceae bacterium]|nr:FAD-dependent oxidoreductase [Nitrospiraceae bacterium]